MYSSGVEAWEGKEEPPLPARKKVGIILGVVGLALLFGSALSLRFVPESLQLTVLVLIGAGAAAMGAAYLLVR